jgi:hypothetical protein
MGNHSSAVPGLSRIGPEKVRTMNRAFPPMPAPRRIYCAETAATNTVTTRYIGRGMEESRRTSPDPSLLETMPSLVPPTAETDHIAPMRDALALADRTQGLSPEAYATLIGGLADVLIDQRRYPDAEPYALKALAIRDSLAGPDAAVNGMVKMSRDQLVKLYEGWGKMEKAASYRDAPPR